MIDELIFVVAFLELFVMMVILFIGLDRKIEKLKEKIEREER